MQQLPHLSSIIICPPTLVGHWPHEIAKFVGSDQVSIVQVNPTADSRHRVLLSHEMHAKLPGRVISDNVT